MTKLNHWMRRLVALLLCACMLLGNVGTGLSELTKSSRLVQPLTQEQIAALAANGPLTEAPLSEYTSSLAMTTNPELSQGQVVTDGMPLEVRLNFEFSSGTIGEGTTEEKTDYWIRHAHTLGLVNDNTVFYVPITAVTRLEGSNYPKAGNPRVAEYLGVPAFKWWVDEANNRICFQFLQAVFHESADVTGMNVSFSGQLNLEEGAGSNTLQFGVVGETVTLTAQQEYTLTKSVVTQPYYSAEEGCYLADFQVKLTTKRDMLLSKEAANPDGLFAAALTLKDTLAAGSVLSGEVVGTPTITSPKDSATVTITNTPQADDTTNLMTLSSDGVMKAGDHIIRFTMKLTDEAVLKAATEYSAAQKTNYVELLENEQPFQTPLTSQVQVDLTNVKNNQFKIFKYEYSQPDSYFGPVYSVKNPDGTLSYRSDFHVIVMIDKEVKTFTFEDRVNHSMNFFADEPVTLVGVWNGEGFMEANRNTPIANFAQVDASTVTVTNEVRTERNDQPNYFNKVTVTANGEGLLAPGAYLFKIPADLTRPIEITLNNDGYGQYYGNTVYLTNIDDLTPTNISSRHEGRIPVLQLPNKVGTFQTVAENGHNSLVMHNGKPVIRWDVPFSWDMPHAFTLVDTMENMELLIDGGHPFHLHVIKNGESNKLLLNLNSLEDCVDNNIIDWYPDEGGVFKLNLTNVGDHALTDKDGEPVVSYKLVYFTTPATVGDSYVLNGIRNTIDTSVNIPDTGISDTFPPSVGIPTLGAEKELTILKAFNEELNDTTTEWTITLQNPDQALFSHMSKLEILDIVPYRQHTDDIKDNKIESNKTYFMPGEVTIHQGMAPIVRMDDMTLEAGTDYQVEYRLQEGTENCYTMAIVFNIKALQKKVTDDTFDNITVTTYLKNPRRELLGQEKNDAYIRNNGTANYTYLGVDLTCNHTAQSPKKRSFAQREKTCLGYGDAYNAETGTYDAKGDGIKDILWQLHIGAREFKITNKEHVVTITDTLTGDHVFPVYEGKEFKDLFTIVSKNRSSETLEVQSATLSEDRKSFTMTFVIPAPQNGIGWAGDRNVADDNNWYSSNILITYHTVIDQEALDAKRQAAIAKREENVTLEYGNAALMDWYNDNPEAVEVNGSHILSTSMLDKVASVNDTTNQISYTIPINEQALTLNNGEPLVLRDQLTDGGANFLYQEPIVLKNVRTGQVLTPGSAVSETTYILRMLEGNAKGFEIKVPDGMSLLLTYQVVPKLAAGQKTAKLTNEASLNGLVKTHENPSYQVSAATEGVVVTPQNNEVIISIEKLKKSGFEAHLSGAVFTATPVKADGTLETDASKILTATSDATGFARFSIPVTQANGFSIVYCIRETQAPTGHKLDAANVWYYLLRSETDPTAEALQAVEALVAAGKTVKTVYKKSIEEIVCYNEPIYTSLQVYKQNKTGTALTGAEFMLTDANGTGVGNPVYDATAGCLVFSKLEFGTYTLTETKPPVGYQTATPNSWTIVLNPGEDEEDAGSVSVVWPENTDATAKAYVVAAPNATSLTVINDAATASLPIPVEKILDGAEKTDQVFTFQLEAITAGAPLPGSLTVQTAKDATYTDSATSVSFGPITFDNTHLGQTYQYRITEADAGDSFIGDDAVYTVTVAVAWENNAIVAGIQSITKDGVAAESIAFTNKYVPYTPETVNVAVKKVWDDKDDQDGLRPASLTVTLSNGTEVTLNKDNEWSATVENLPKYAAGKEITYTWSEPVVTGYTCTNTAESSVTDEETKQTTILTTITNSRTTETVNVAVKKVWDDMDNQDGKRPDSLKVTLSNGTEVTLNKDNEWSATVENLPKYAAGKEITYTWSEPEVTGYTRTNTAKSSVTDEETKKTTILTTITNSHTTETVNVAVKKVWDDADNQDGKRPTSLMVTLSNGTEVTLNKDNEWSATVENLPKYAAGKEITYTWSEPEVTGYTLTNSEESSVTDEETKKTTILTTITNSHTPETVNVAVKKVWEDEENQDGKRPASLKVTLSNGTEVTLNKDNEWSATVENLPKYAAGKEITYTWSEPEVTGYTLTNSEESSVTDEETKKTTILTTITNSHTPETVNVAVKKVWDDMDNQDGKRPASLKVTLSNGTEVTLNKDNEWSATVENLPKYAAGKEITYTWSEPVVTGYTRTNTAESSVTDEETKQTTILTTITNSHTTETVNVAVKKVWDDKDNQDGKRPASLKVTLSNGQTYELNAKNDWTITVKNLPKYAAGKEITYTWSEPVVTGYTRTNTAESSVTDEETKQTTILTTITNSHTTETVNVAVKKVWDDMDNQDGKRPTSLKVTLSNGQTYELNAKNDWTITVKNLPKYAAGKEITYTWSEVIDNLPEGYSFDGSVESDLKDEEGNVIGALTTITNSYTPKTIQVAGTKTWDDADNQDGIRPERIIINLLADETIIDKAEVKANEAGEWTWEFTDLPQYRDQGVEIAYSITETLEEGSAYTAMVDGYNVTNTYTPATVDVTGSKIWIDLNNAYHTRPESITVRLYADGTEIATQEANADNNWSWSFTDLPKFAVGQVGHEVTYTVTEDSVPGYVTTQNGYNFTNTVQVVAFQKLDEQTGKPLSGAQFALYEGRLTAPTGTPLMTWTSTGTPSVLAGLGTGKTYTIFETKTPFGYVTMTPFVFTVQPTDIPATMRTFVANNCHSYRFRKLSTVNNELVYGAELAIKQGDTVIATWYTDFENDGWHYVADARFKPGVTYTLEELTAPNGYQLAAPVRFTIDSKDGFLIVNGNDTNDMSVVMYDQPVPEATATPEPTTTSFRITKRWEDQDNVLGLRPNSIEVSLYRKTSNDAAYPDAPYLTVTMNSDGTDEWTFTFDDLPRRDGAGRLYTYMAQETPVDGYVASYLNNGRTIVNSIPKEDLPPTPTPTLPYVTPTPSPMPRVPAGVQFVGGRWVYVDEYGVPLGGVPLTGDTTNFALWGSAIALPMIIAALAAVEIRRRKRRMAAEGTEE